MDATDDATLGEPDAASLLDGAAPDAFRPDAPELPEDATGMQVVLAFEQLLIARCTCEVESGCADAWTDQFDDTRKVCVAGAIDQAGVSRCSASGMRELLECWYGADCGRCAAAALTEDTPLADLVEESCDPEQSSAYRAALRAASCGG